MSTKDNAGSLVAGIMWHAEQQRVNNERIKQQQDKTNEEIKRNAELSEIIKREQKKSNDTVLDLEEDVGELQKALLDTVKIAANLKKENEYYKSLLAKPMQVIAEHNGDFKKTYEEQQALLADWMVSQKAFKELAIQFGFDAHGHTPEQVKEMGLEKEIDVLEDKNDPSHKTNFSDSTHPEPRRQALLEKYHKDKAARKAKKGS